MKKLFNNPRAIRLLLVLALLLIDWLSYEIYWEGQSTIMLVGSAVVGFGLILGIVYHEGGTSHE